jgi:hypothetical protein
MTGSMVLRLVNAVKMLPSRNEPQVLLTWWPQGKTNPGARMKSKSDDVSNEQSNNGMNKQERCRLEFATAMPTRICNSDAGLNLQQWCRLEQARAMPARTRDGDAGSNKRQQCRLEFGRAMIAWTSKDGSNDGTMMAEMMVQGGFKRWRDEGSEDDKMLCGVGGAQSCLGIENSTCQDKILYIMYCT